MGHVLCHFWSTNALLFCGDKKKRLQSGWCSLGIQMWSQSCTSIVCTWSAGICIFKYMSSQDPFCLRGPRSSHYCCSAAQSANVVLSAEVQLCHQSLFHLVQKKISSSNSSATLILSCYYSIISMDTNLLSLRSVGSSLNPCLTSEMEVCCSS